MNNLLTALCIGVIAGIIDALPMIFQKLDKRATVSAFLHYFALGIIIPFVNWNLPPMLIGTIIALLTSIPIMIIVYPKDKKAIIPMTIFSVLLGAGIGITGAIFIA